jgi:hypothetical protein
MTDDVTAGSRDLRACYRRVGGPPLWPGDSLDDQRVTGLALIVDPGPADHVLVDGDENLAVPPYRPLPVPGNLRAGIERNGPPPIDDGADNLLREAPQGVSEGLDRQLRAMGEAGDFTRRLLGHIAAEKHQAWLVGGAVRDLMLQGTAARPADLDFTGTMGPGELYDAMRRWRRVEGAADYRLFISPRLVWAVAPPGGSRQDAFLEYKPLSQPGFRFPAWGGTLACDAATRDLTINAIYYDHGNRIVADPTGRAVKDLLAKPPVGAPAYRGDDPVEQASVILRCVKFRLRWPELDIAEISVWAAGLPEDTVVRIPAARWEFLTGLHRRCVPERHRGEDELAAAEEIGPVAVRLVEQIRVLEKAGA